MLRTLFAVIVLTSAAPAFAQDCASSRPYEGAPLRAAPSAADFPSASPTPKPMSAARTAKFVEVVSAFEAAVHPPALNASVLTDAGESWSLRTGDARLFYWASAGKAWTAIATLQLVDEGKLELSDTLDRWAPDFPNAKIITVEHLLTHTSGLFSFNEDETLRATPGDKSREDVLAAAGSHAPLFCPGQTWAYSNTGYALLGLIIEKIDGRPFDRSLKARIADRLHLEDTRILGPSASLDGIAPPRPASAPSGADSDIRTPGAAGPVAASATDMARFWYAALSGELTTAKSARDQFAKLYPMSFQPGSSYGRGVILYDVPASPKTPADTWLGHSGGLPGVKAVIAWSVKQRAVAAVALTGDGPAEALANRLLATLE